MSKIFSNVRGNLMFVLAASLIAPCVTYAKGPGGGGPSHGGAGSAPRVSMQTGTPSFQSMKSFSAGSNFGSAQSLSKFNGVTVKSGLSNVNAIRMTDRFATKGTSDGLKKSKLPGVNILERSGDNKLHTSIKLSDAIKKGPKLTPDLVHKINPKIVPKPIDPGKGNAQKYCKPHCIWPWFPSQIGWFPYGCYPYGYPYGGYRFGCYNTVSYINASATPVIDLALVDVRMVEPATMATGPAYRVKFRNVGNAAAGSFRMAIFGSLDGELSEACRSVADITGLGAGEATSVTLRLPISAMQMSSASEQNVPFKLLTVALDIDNVVTESVKDNNAATLERSSFETR